MARNRKKGLQLESADDKLRITAEERAQLERDSRSAALALSGSAIWRGATVDPYDPCGFDEVIDAVFGEDKDLCKKRKQ